MGKKSYKKMTRDELKRQRQNHLRLQQVIDKRFTRDGLTREEIMRRLVQSDNSS
jgi:hypothetical protein